MSSLRKRLLKQPMYETKAEASSTSPVRMSSEAVSEMIDSFQRAPSALSAVISRCAKPSFFSSLSATASTSSFSALAASYWRVSSATVSSASFLAASAASLEAMAAARSSAALLPAMRMGSTFSLMSL